MPGTVTMEMISGVISRETGDTGWDVVLYFKSLAPIRSIISTRDETKLNFFSFSIKDFVTIDKGG